jgi:hypothetical protein
VLLAVIPAFFTFSHPFPKRQPISPLTRDLISNVISGFDSPLDLLSPLLRQSIPLILIAKLRRLVSIWEGGGSQDPVSASHDWAGRL